MYLFLLHADTAYLDGVLVFDEAQELSVDAEVAEVAVVVVDEDEGLPGDDYLTGSPTRVRRVQGPK